MGLLQQVVISEVASTCPSLPWHRWRRNAESKPMASVREDCCEYTLYFSPSRWLREEVEELIIRRESEPIPEDLGTSRIMVEVYRTGRDIFKKMTFVVRDDAELRLVEDAATACGKKCFLTVVLDRLGFRFGDE